MSDKQSDDHPTEPEIAERLNRGLRRAFTMKPKPHDKPKKNLAEKSKRQKE